MGDGPALAVRNRLDDYSEVQGVMVPFRSVTDMQLMSAVQTTVKYEVNVPIDDAKLAPPLPGTDAAVLIVPSLAGQLAAILEQRVTLEARIKELLEAHSLSQILTSLPGVGVRIAATLLVCIGDASAFPDAAHLASYAGLTPVTRRSGSSTRGEYTSHAGNKRLKRAMFLSAFASLRSDPVSRAYYDRKIAQGKRHNQAVIALAHRRILTLHAMIRNGTLYDPQPAHQLPAAA